MGVKGLWRLLLPIGRRISLESLEGQVLAIDASIWLTQFLLAMRDPDTGRATPGAHLLGFMRRICRLQFYGIRAVFVFDGATPEIKKRETKSRRKKRQDQFTSLDEASVKRLAKRLLAENWKKSKARATAAKATTTKGEAIINRRKDVFSLTSEDIDEKPVAATDSTNGIASMPESEVEESSKRAATAVQTESAATSKEDEEAILAAIREDMEGQTSKTESTNDWDLPINDEQKVDYDDDDNNSHTSYEDFGINTATGHLDAQQISTLPATKRKDAIEQAKRQQRLASRKEFMPAAAHPDQFSQVQLSNFLKSSRFNLDIQQMAVAAVQRDNEGLPGEAMASDQTMRITLQRENDDDEPTLPQPFGNNNGRPVVDHRPLRRLGEKSSRTASTDSQSSDDDVVWEGSSTTGVARAAPINSDERSMVDASTFHRAAVVQTSAQDAPPAQKKRRVIEESSDEDESEEEEEGGFLTQAARRAPAATNNEVIELDGDSDNEEEGFAKVASTMTNRNDPPALAALNNPHDVESEEEGGFLKEDSSSAAAAGAAEVIDVDQEDETDDPPLGNIEGVVQSKSAAPKGDLGLVTHTIDRDEALAQELEDGVLAKALQEAEDSFGLSHGLATDTGNNQQVVRGHNEILQAAVRSAAAMAGNKEDDEAEEDESVSWEDGDDELDAEQEKNKSADNAAVGQAVQPATGGENNQSPTHNNDKPASSDEAEDDIDWENGNDQTDVDESKGKDSDDNLRAGSKLLTSDFEKIPEPSPKKVYKTGGNSIRVESNLGLDEGITQYARDAESGGAAELWEEPDGERQDAFSSETAAALKQAENTAANMANWAGRVFRRAVKEASQQQESRSPQGEHSSPGTKSALPISSPKDSKPKEQSKNESASSFSPNFPQRDSRPGRYQAEEPRQQRVSPVIAIDDLAEGVARKPPSLDEVDASKIDMMLGADEQWSVKRGQEKYADSVTDEMREEAMHLLELFGIPYVEAPAEAEAQCVILEKLGLVDGIVTEDSDAFVFGAKKVYKNIFEDKHYTEAYVADDAKREMKLNHNSFVALAMLLGCDYTEGVKGVGIVNAMEVLTAFDVKEDLKDGLSKFKGWLGGFDAFDAGCDSKVDPDTLTTEQVFHMKHRTARVRWSPPANFPSEQVMQAFLNPVVDNSKGRFSWGVPDLQNLIVFCGRNIGMKAEDTKKMLEPVLARKDGMRQTRIDSFMKYEENIKFAEVRSKRLREVLGLGSSTAEREGGSKQRKTAASKESKKKATKHDNA